MDSVRVVGEVEEGFAVGAAIADEALEGISHWWNFESRYYQEWRETRSYVLGLDGGYTY